MKIDRQGQAAGIAPTERGFVGDVRIANYHRRVSPSRMVGAMVSFEPGARTPWKTNPFGQTLVVLTGRGLVGNDDGDVVAIGAGDVVWWSPEERHWDGAAPDSPMTYFALQEEDGDASVTFGDAVTDAAYRGGPSTS